jgi:hypothetical protein
MPNVLGEIIRIPMSGFESPPQVALPLFNATGSVDASIFGGNFDNSIDYLEGRSNAGVASATTSAIMQYQMPANYIADSEFQFKVGVVDDNSLDGSELVGKFIQLGVLKILLDNYTGGSGPEILPVTNIAITSGDYTEYTFTCNPGGLIALEPGDMIGLNLKTVWARVTTASKSIVVSLQLVL